LNTLKPPYPVSRPCDLTSAHLCNLLPYHCIHPCSVLAILALQCLESARLISATGPLYGYFLHLECSSPIWCLGSLLHFIQLCAQISPLGEYFPYTISKMLPLHSHSVFPYAALVLYTNAFNVALL
jgi:hypothetical protein